MLESFAEVATSVARNKVRTLLTVSGVFWGMLMLVLMLGFGNGLEAGVQKSMGGFATNAVYMWGQRTTMPYRGRGAGRSVQFRSADLPALLAIDGIEHMAPRLQLGGHRGAANVVWRGKAGSFSVAGDYPAFQYVQPVRFDAGRYINALDIQERRKVAIIGKNVREQLFPPGRTAIGEWIRIRGVAFQVVGVFHSSQSGDGADRQDNAVHVPFTTFQQVFNAGDRIGWLAFTGVDDLPAGDLEDRVREVLVERHAIHPDDPSALGSFNAEEEFQKIRKLFAGIRILIWVVGVATLLSGVVGVSNILLITVRERTVEIGLRRAIGATPLSVVTMILQEAFVLTAIAGYSGLVAGVALVEVAALVIDPDAPDATLGPPHVDLGVALAAAGVLLVGGLMAGFVPARRAAAIHPVDALRGQG